MDVDKTVESAGDTWSVKKSKKRKSDTMDVDSSRKDERPYFPPAKKSSMVHNCLQSKYFC